MALPFLVAGFLPLGADSSIVLNGVTTKVVFLCDNKKYEVETQSNVLSSALLQTDCRLGDRDILVPPPETKLRGVEVQAKIVRALPVYVLDGDKPIYEKSAYSDKMEILAQLGIKISPEDIVEKNLILSDFEDTSLGQKIIIKRAPTYTLCVDGLEQTLRSWKKTVGEVLADKEVPLGAKDEILPASGSYVRGGESIIVTRVNEVEISEEEQIPYQTIVKKDYYMYKGQSSVEVAGENGKKIKTYKVIYRNGQVSEKILLTSEITENAENRVITEGVKPYNAGVWWDDIVAASQIFGVNASAMYSVMICESGGNPYSGTYYKGLFQYSPDTWAGASSAYPGGVYVGASITDGRAQIYVTAWKVSLSGWSAWGCKP